jgi:putative spermidine/putrescine transport system ATP-binding protein
MNKGVIEQFDTPEEIYNNPKTEFVARFIGFENFFELTPTEEWNYKAIDGTVFHSTRDWEPGKRTGTIRPDDIEIVRNTKQNTKNTLSGIIKVRTFLGKSYQYEVETPIGKLLANKTDDVVYQVGDEVTLSMPSHKLIIV